MDHQTPVPVRDRDDRRRERAAEGELARFWHWVDRYPRAERAQGYLEGVAHAVAMDLPCEDPSATFDDYAGAVLAALGEADDVILVGHSLAGVTLPIHVCRHKISIVAWPEADRRPHPRGGRRDHASVGRRARAFPARSPSRRRD